MFHPHVERNREPILAVLKRLLPARALVLEMASGSGEHAAFFAKALPGASWLPSDIDPKALASIAAFRAEAAVPNLLGPLRLDTTAEVWPVKRVNAIVAATRFTAPWAACRASRRRRPCVATRRHFILVRSVQDRRPSYRAPIRILTPGCAGKIRMGHPRHRRRALATELGLALAGDRADAGEQSGVVFGGPDAQVPRRRRRAKWFP